MNHSREKIPHLKVASYQLIALMRGPRSEARGGRKEAPAPMAEVHAMQRRVTDLSRQHASLGERSDGREALPSAPEQAAHEGYDEHRREGTMSTEPGH
jgi:hypothetical protein